MHVMMVMMVMVMMMVMMVMMMLRRGHGGGRRSGFLREGVSGEAERERGRGGEGLDHWKAFLWLGQTQTGRGGR